MDGGKGLCQDDMENSGATSSLLSSKWGQRRCCVQSSQLLPCCFWSTSLVPWAEVRASGAVGLWAYPSKAPKGGSAFIENTCWYVHDSVGLVWKTTETPSSEACQDRGSEGRRCGHCLLMSHTGVRGDLPHLQAMVAAIATQPKKDEVSDCTSSPSPDES